MQLKPNPFQKPTPLYPTRRDELHFVLPMSEPGVSEDVSIIVHGYQDDPQEAARLVVEFLAYVRRSPVHDLEDRLLAAARE